MSLDSSLNVFIVTVHECQGRIQDIGIGGQSWRSRTLAPKLALNRVLRAMLVPSRTLYACKRKFLQCEATRTVESSITGVATNNYSMNFNYLATRGGTGPRFSPGSATECTVVDNLRDPLLLTKMKSIFETLGCF